MSDCVEERTSQHFRGRWHGFGPVKDGEKVIFAVFQSTNCLGNRLTAVSFNNNHLKKSAQSLARQAFVTRKTFNRTIVDGAELRGVATADVSALRALVADVKLNVREITVRSLCVLDRVETGDCDGHATTGYSEKHATLGLSQTQLSKVRERIRLDLANTFSEICDPSEQGWISLWEIVIGRVKSITRTICSII
jgi:hypothetical protein